MRLLRIVYKIYKSIYILHIRGWYAFDFNDSKQGTRLGNIYVNGWASDMVSWSCISGDLFTCARCIVVLGMRMRNIYLCGCRVVVLKRNNAHVMWWPLHSTLYKSMKRKLRMRGEPRWVGDTYIYTQTKAKVRQFFFICAPATADQMYWELMAFARVGPCFIAFYVLGRDHQNLKSSVDDTLHTSVGGNWAKPLWERFKQDVW